MSDISNRCENILSVAFNFTRCPLYRGKADCGDIDILITRPVDDGKTHAGILAPLFRELHAIGILTEDLSVPEDCNDLEAVYHGLCCLPVEGSRRRRIDFLTVPWASKGAALLYYTVGLLVWRRSDNNNVTIAR